MLQRGWNLACKSRTIKEMKKMWQKKCVSDTINNEPFLFKKENVIPVHYLAKLFYRRNTHTHKVHEVIVHYRR